MGLHGQTMTIEGPNHRKIKRKRSSHKTGVRGYDRYPALEFANLLLINLNFDLLPEDVTYSLEII